MEGRTSQIFVELNGRSVNIKKCTDCQVKIDLRGIKQQLQLASSEYHNNNN